MPNPAPFPDSVHKTGHTLRQSLASRKQTHRNFRWPQCKLPLFSTRAERRAGICPWLRVHRASRHRGAVQSRQSPLACRRQPSKVWPSVRSCVLSPPMPHLPLPRHPRLTGSPIVDNLAQSKGLCICRCKAAKGLATFSVKFHKTLPVDLAL